MSRADETWRYEIQHGPDGETNYAWVYCDDELVCTTKTHHAATIVRAVNCHDEMLVALHNVRRLISEAAQTGFNWKDGDWTQRLYESQRVTRAAFAKAEGKP